ncbi:MAG: LysE family transporter [Candidatus Delongbacteria bacterium]|nr:LysE family transporter [Candidatus Delongbacteria bacterium]MCG2761552.1 LysE family transporter [Candidatus Delongbacteria bacterium]
MQSDLLIPFITYAMVSSFTPGPNNITSTASGMLLGYRKSLPYFFGIISGFILIMFMSGSLTSFLTKTGDFIFPVMKWIGATYIIWLAVSPLLSYGSIGNRNKNSNYTFYSGLTMQLVNIKLILYGTTIYSSFSELIRDSFISVIFSSLFLTSIAFASISMWALIGTTLRKHFENKRFYYIFNSILAVMLLKIAVSILIQTQKN